MTCSTCNGEHWLLERPGKWSFCPCDTAEPAEADEARFRQRSAAEHHEDLRDNVRLASKQLANTLVSARHAGLEIDATLLDDFLREAPVLPGYEIAMRDVDVWLTNEMDALKRVENLQLQNIAILLRGNLHKVRERLRDGESRRAPETVKTPAAYLEAAFQVFGIVWKRSSAFAPRGLPSLEENGTVHITWAKDETTVSLETGADGLSVSWLKRKGGSGAKENLSMFDAVQSIDELFREAGWK